VEYHLYIMISHTDTGLGRAIRYLTEYDYNHISLSLDSGFRNWVSFARYAQNVPLAGGFVVETPERFLSSGKKMPVRIFRLNLSENRFRTLKKLFSEAGNADCGLIYNSFGAIATALNLSFPVRSAYTCLEFANAVLEEQHRTIRHLNERLDPHLIFEGDLHSLVDDNGSRQADYFRHRNPMTALRETAIHFMKLLHNTVHPNQQDLVAIRLRLH